jgi:hypothetical protein
MESTFEQPAHSNVLDWLLEEDNPSVRYRTLTELLDVSLDV